MIKRRASGFTLIELLVVITIIMVLAAILFPVFKSVRGKAKQANCRSNLHQVSIALKAYRQDFGHYPPAPYYYTAGGRYVGGLSALAPDYITDRKMLICPNDAQARKAPTEASQNGYSSYNGWVTDPTASWDFASGTFHRADNAATTIVGPTRYYNFFGYTQEGTDPHWFVDAGNKDIPYYSTVPTWLTNQGLRLRHYPRLMNRNAPDNTYVTHCVHHRKDYGKATAEMDIYLTVGGSTKTVNVKQMEKDTSGASDWVTQQD